MAVKTKSKLEQMKEAIAGAGEGGNSSFLFFKSDGEKHVVRFTQDLEDTVGLVMYEPKVFGNKLSRFACPSNFGGKALADLSDYKKPFTMYFFAIYDYDPEDKSKEKGEMKILPVKATSKSLLSQIVAYSEDDEDGGLDKRDYVIKRNGSGKETTYSINARVERDTPLSVKKAAKELTPEKIKEACKEFFKAPSQEDWEEDDEENVKPKKETKAAKNGKSSKPAKEYKKPAWEDEDDSPDDEDTKAALKRTKELDSYDDDSDE